MDIGVTVTATAGLAGAGNKVNVQIFSKIKAVSVNVFYLYCVKSFNLISMRNSYLQKLLLYFWAGIRVKVPRALLLLRIRRLDGDLLILSKFFLNVKSEKNHRSNEA
jgi:hypothetical protein